MIVVFASRETEQRGLLILISVRLMGSRNRGREGAERRETRMAECRYGGGQCDRIVSSKDDECLDGQGRKDSLVRELGETVD